MKLQKSGNELILESAGIGSGARDPDIDVLSDGRLIVAWSEVLEQPTGEFDDTDGAAFVRILDSSGIPQSEIIQINDFEPFKQDRVEVVALSDGSFAVGWTSNQTFGDSPSDSDTFLRYFDKNGIPFNDFKLDFSADTASNAQFLGEIVGLTENRVAVILEEPDTAGNTANIYDSGGALISSLTQRVDDFVQLADGNLVLAAVVENDLDGVGDRVQLQIFDNRLSFPKNIEGIYEPLTFFVEGSAATSKSKNFMQLAALANGGVVVAFLEEGLNGNSNLNMTFLSDVGQIEFEDVLTPIRLPFDSNKAAFDMIGLKGGGVAVAVTDEDDGSDFTGVDVLLFDADGTLLTKLQASASDLGNQSRPKLAEADDGTISMVFEDFSNTAATLDSNTLRLVQFKIDGQEGRFVGSEGDDFLRGVGGDETLVGLAGNDRMIGNRGNDTLRGGEGDDNLAGNAGNDALRGGQGNDKLNGGEGSDGLGGGDGNDRIKGGDGRDILSGGQGRDRLDGGAGNDLLKGGAGIDILVGGNGSDVFQFVRGLSGADRILDFDAADDSLLIDLRGAKQGIIEVSTLRGDTLVEFGNASVRLEDVTLEESDITFLYI